MVPIELRRILPRARVTRRQFINYIMLAGLVGLSSHQEAFAKVVYDKVQTPGYFADFIKNLLAEQAIAPVALGNFRIFSQAERHPAFYGTEISDRLKQPPFLQPRMPQRALEEVENPVVVRNVVEENDGFLIWYSPFYQSLATTALREANFGLIQRFNDSGITEFTNKNQDIFQTAGLQVVSNDGSSVLCSDRNGNQIPVMRSRLVNSK